MEGSLFLRRAVEEDMNQLFLWANDPAVRRNAFHTEPILYEDHVRWFKKTMADDRAFQYILCDGGVPAGQVRINVEGQTGMIDYSIAPAQRGRGLGNDIIALVVERAASEICGIDCLIGQVRHGNTASARVFERCGFKKTDRSGYILFELALLPAGASTDKRSGGHEDHDRDDQGMEHQAGGQL